MGEGLLGYNFLIFFQPPNSFSLFENSIYIFTDDCTDFINLFLKSSNFVLYTDSNVPYLPQHIQYFPVHAFFRQDRTGYDIRCVCFPFYIPCLSVTMLLFTVYTWTSLYTVYSLWTLKASTVITKHTYI